MNNNDNNTEGLNAVSLGSMDNGNNLNVPLSDIPPVNPVEPQSEVEVESLDNIDNNMVANDVPVNPIPDINAIPSPDAVIPVAPEPLSYDIPDVINTAPVFNDIGTVPPIPNAPMMQASQVVESMPPKKKNGINKILFVIIILIALAAVGVGVYVVLQKANAPKVVTKAVKIEIGDDISTKIVDYATFTNMDSSTCALDTSKIVSTTELGAKYDFYVTCEGTSYKGVATIVDTIAPEVDLREVEIGLNGEVQPSDFISECQDATECSYSFKEEDKIQEYLKTAASYHVPIIVKDEAGNEKEVMGVLVVTEDTSTAYLVCSITNDGVEEINRFGLEGANFNKFTTRLYVFTFDSKDAYDEFKNENADKKEVTYNDITGSPSFNDDNNTLTITKKVSENDLKEEIETDVPTSFSELRDLYQEKNYSCNIQPK